MERLAGKVVVVTGGARGIGRACAARYVDEGARVAIVDVDEVAGRKAARELGPSAIAVATDVSDSASVMAMVGAVLEQFGTVDVLVNNAARMAGIPRRSFLDIPEDEWDQVMQVNVRGTWNCCRAVAGHLQRQRSGKIINVASDTALSGAPGLLHYVSSKGALLAFTRALARELGTSGICVNALVPGFTETDAALASDDGARAARIAGRALRRPETPDDLTGAAVFLASSDSDFITGQMIVVNGGYVFN